MNDQLVWTQAYMVEQTFLGQMLEKPSIVTETRLTEEDFDQASHKRIFRILSEMAAEGTEINLVSFVTNCKKDDLEVIGGVSYIAELIGATVTSANWTYYENQVRRYYIIRESQKIGEQIAESTDIEEMEELVAKKKKLDDLLNAKDTSFNMKEKLMKIFDDIEKDRSGQLSGIPTGFTDLDRITDGLQLQDLIIVGARPSVGKTAFALNVGQQAAKKDDTAVTIFSLEMPDEKLLTRMISAEGNVDSEKLKRGKDFLTGDDWEKLTMAISVIHDLDIDIQDTPGPTVAEIRRHVQQRIEGSPKKRHLIIIDYLTLIRSSIRSENRNAQVEQISRDLKLMARELNVCVICLSQLSRKVEERQDKRPMMSDLRESGAIEQDADVIAFLYRDDYYDAESEKKNIIEINIAKHRNGPTGVVELVFMKNFNKFVSLDRGHHQAG